MRSPKIFVFALLTSLALFFFRGEIQKFFAAVRSLAVSFSDRSFSYVSFKEIKSENQRLKFELESLKKKFPPARDSNYLKAEVYSRYPFNDRGLLIINLGAEDGLEAGLPVLTESGVPLGLVKTIKKTQSEVLTIFDPNWKSSVAIGESRTKAVLKGGVWPTLELIPEDAKIAEGDAVINISPEFPIDLIMGNAVNIKKTAEDVWFTAGFKALYESEDVDKVKVLLWNN